MSWTALHSTGTFVGQCGEEDTMEDVAVVGVDLAKSVFQVHGIDGRGQVVLRRKLSRSKLLAFFATLPRCLVGMETCASANYWARELMTLGHEVRLMPPQYVKPYVKRSKNDASDAEAICEAVTRPTMRFVGVKSTEQQSVLPSIHTGCRQLRSGH
jgi:transposase